MLYGVNILFGIIGNELQLVIHCLRDRMPHGGILKSECL